MARIYVDAVEAAKVQGRKIGALTIGPGAPVTDKNGKAWVLFDDHRIHQEHVDAAVAFCGPTKVATSIDEGNGGVI